MMDIWPAMYHDDDIHVFGDMKIIIPWSAARCMCLKKEKVRFSCEIDQERFLIETQVCKLRVLLRSRVYAKYSVDTIYDLRLAEPIKNKGEKEAREGRRFLRLYTKYVFCSLHTSQSGARSARSHYLGVESYPYPPPKRILASRESATDGCPSRRRSPLYMHIFHHRSYSFSTRKRFVLPLATFVDERHQGRGHRRLPFSPQRMV